MAKTVLGISLLFEHLFLPFLLLVRLFDQSKMESWVDYLSAAPDVPPATLEPVKLINKFIYLNSRANEPLKCALDSSLYSP